MMSEKKAPIPETVPYIEKIARLWGELGDKKTAARWLANLDPQKAEELWLKENREKAEQALKKFEESGDLFEKRMAAHYFEEMGDEESARELIKELIVDYEAGRGNLHWVNRGYEIAALYAKLDEEKGKELFLKHARYLEDKLNARKQNSEELKDEESESLLFHWIIESYKKAGAEEEVRRIYKQELTEIEEETGDPEHPLVGYYLEQLGLGQTERAKKANQKIAEHFEKCCRERIQEKGVNDTSLMLMVLPIMHYQKAGNLEKVKALWREQAELEEERGNKEGAMRAFAHVRDRENVKRLLKEVMEYEDDMLKFVQCLLDWAWLDNDEGCKNTAKSFALWYAGTKENSSDPEDKREAISAYVKVISILEDSIYSHLKYLWEKRSVYNEL